MPKDALERVLECQSLPSLPTVAVRILELTRDPGASMSAIAEAVQTDVALTVKVLRTVNSSYYGLTKPCNSLSRAMSLLGLTTVKSIVLSFSLIDVTRLVGARASFDLTQYFRRAVYGATAAQLFMATVRGADPEEAFVGGLLQDIGMLGALAALGQEYAGIIEAAGEQRHDNLIGVERRAFGFDHARAGGMLGQRWKLPPALVECIVHHHTPLSYAGGNAELVRAVALGTSVVATFALPKPEAAASIETCLTRAREWFGLSEDAAKGIIQDCVRRGAELSKALELATGQVPDVASILMEAHEAMARTQEELTREQARLKRETEELARKAAVDGLTGVFNRVTYDRTLRESLESCRRAGQPVSVIFLDADRFKSVNDEYGHQAGDAVLIETARRLRETIDRFGTLCRYGGEEFVLVLPNVDLERACKVGELLRRVVEQTPFDLARYEIPGVVLRRTISVGVACSQPGAPSENWTAEQLTHHADEAVYAAKQAGRNCVRWKTHDGRIEPGGTGCAGQAAEGRVRVLIIDDDAFTLRLLQTLAGRRGGFVTTCADSPEAALRLCEGRESFDLILVDHHLGQHDGAALIGSLRERPASRAATFVLMSGRTGAEAESAAREAGAAMFLDKMEVSANAAACLDRLADLVRGRREAA
jgi:two-component system cell cycle response regulator